MPQACGQANPFASTVPREVAAALGDAHQTTRAASARVVASGRRRLARNPGGEWMKQTARNLLDADDGFMRGKRYLILDCDPLYMKEFRQMLRGAGVTLLLLPSRSPNLNAYAERFVLSIKSECLDRIVPLGEGHLRRTVGEYLAHYHRERNHQGLDSVLLNGAPTPANENGRVKRRERLGGLLNYYHRRVA